MDDWKKEAACTGIEIEVFYDPAHTAVAVGYCTGCPVKATCLTVALDTPERFGVWGGLTADEREELRDDSDQRHD